MTIRRVLITGANKGIGRATAEAVLRADDDTVVLLGSRDPDRGSATKAELAVDEPGWVDRIHVVTIDVGSAASVKAAADHIATQFGRDPAPLYGLVNNAGIAEADGIAPVIEVNTYGPKRVCEAFLPLLDPEHGRVVNISSAAGPNFVAECSPEHQARLTAADATWAGAQATIDACLAVEAERGDFRAAGLGDGSAYGLSKACLNTYTIELARKHPNLVINACTPGFIETDLTRPWAEARGVAPAEMGMKPPEAATRAPLHLLFGEPGGSGWYFGSDAVRSPLDRYRSPGDPPYTGD